MLPLMRIIFIFNSNPYSIYHLVILLSNFNLGSNDHSAILWHDLYDFLPYAQKDTINCSFMTQFILF